MKKATAATRDIDDYIAGFPSDVQVILEKLRELIRKVLPKATEAIKYGIPTFVLNGNVVHFAAFKKHIGLYPPVRGDAKLKRDLAPYANAKGNLAFPLDEPMPYVLIRRVVRQLVKDHEARRSSLRK